MTIVWRYLTDKSQFASDISTLCELDMRLKQHGTTAILGANSSLHKKSTPSGPSHVCCDILPERLRLGARDVWHSSVLLLEQRQQSPTTAVTNDSSHLRIILVNLAVYLYDAHNICCTVLFNRGAMQKTVSTAAAAAARATAAAEVGAATDVVVSLALRRRHALCSNSDVMASFIE